MLIMFVIHFVMVSIKLGRHEVTFVTGLRFMCFNKWCSNSSVYLCIALSSTCASSLTAFLAIPPAQFKLVLDSVIWAFKHTMRNVADTGLDILYQMLQNVTVNEAAAQSFYQTYYTDILQHIFSVVTDSSHTAGLASDRSFFLVFLLAGLSDVVEISR
jgi:CRM1 C terminal